MNLTTRLIVGAVLSVSVLSGAHSYSLQKRVESREKLVDSLLQEAQGSLLHSNTRVEELQTALKEASLGLTEVSREARSREANLLRQVQGAVEDIAQMRSEAAERLSAVLSAIQDTRTTGAAEIGALEASLAALGEALAEGESGLASLQDFVAERQAPVAPWATPIKAKVSQSTEVRGVGNDSNVYHYSVRSYMLDIGSGFVVKPGVLVSAGHVFDDTEDTRTQAGTFTPPGGKEPIPVEIISKIVVGRRMAWMNDKMVPLTLVWGQVDPDDAAVCTFPAEAYTDVYPEIDTEDPQYGDIVWVVTYRPEIRDGRVPVRGVVAGKAGGDRHNKDTLIVTLPGLPGFSGSCLMKRGKIVGILVHGHGHADYNFTGYTSIKVALDHLP